MKKQKLNLSQLKVTSFVTDLNVQEQQTIVGAAVPGATTDGFTCPNTQCAGQCSCSRTCPPSANTAVGVTGVKL